MKISTSGAANAVDRPDPARRFYLFHGPDDSGSRALAERLLKSLGAEKFVIPAAGLKADPASLSDEAGAIALFGGPRLIWIEPAGEDIATAVEGLLESGRVESPVVAIAGALKRSSALLKAAEGHKAAAAIASYVPDARDATSMVAGLARNAGLECTPDVAQRVASSADGNRAVMAQEIEKFALYLDADAGRPRSLTNEVVDALGVDSHSGDLSRLGDMALSGEMADLLESLEGGIVGSDSVPVTRAMQRRLLYVAHLRARVERGESPDGVLASLGKSLFWKDKHLVGQLLRHWNAQRLATLVERTSALQDEVILGEAPPLAALGEELVTVARAARRHR